ncbi:MAG: hypothetical protein IPN76_03185 [Saprospiraceae bacterium]|nr:hypothetical protein [Saprospiraceae bacterium]
MYRYYIDQRFGQYKPQWCGNMDDAVEYEGTSKGLDRVSIEFTQGVGGISLFTTKAMTASDGSFSGMLQPNIAGGSTFTAKAKVKKLGPNSDFSYNPGDWRDGVTTFDLVLIRKHILTTDRLDGYDQLAADANHDNAVTTFDQVEFRKVVLDLPHNLGQYYETPWRYVRESITLNNPQDFDDQEDDNPFQYADLEGTSNYVMQTNRQGFDFVKLGDVNGSNSEVNGLQNNPEENSYPIFVDIVKLASPPGKSIYEFRVSDFEDIAAYQFDIEFPASSLQYSTAEAMDLSGLNSEFFGTTKASQGLIKTLWYDEANANAFTLSDGSGLFRLRFDGTT